MTDFVVKGLMWFAIIGDLAAYMPQIIKSIRTKKAEDLSKFTWLLWTSTSIAELIYYFYIGDFLLLVSEFSCLACNLTILILSIKYREKTQPAKDRLSITVPVQEESTNRINRQ